MRISDWSSDVCSSDLNEAISYLSSQETLTLTLSEPGLPPMPSISRLTRQSTCVSLPAVWLRARLSVGVWTCCKLMKPRLIRRQQKLSLLYVGFSPTVLKQARTPAFPGTTPTASLHLIYN